MVLGSFALRAIPNFFLDLPSTAGKLVSETCVCLVPEITGFWLHQPVGGIGQSLEDRRKEKALLPWTAHLEQPLGF